MAFLNGQKVVLVGSPQGYVRNLISELIKMECKVALLSPRFESGALLPDIPGECRGFLWCPVDLKREESLISALNRVQDQWGAFDVAINTIGSLDEGTFQVLSTLTLYPRWEIPRVIQVGSLLSPEKVLSRDEWDGMRGLQRRVLSLQAQFKEQRYPVQLTYLNLPSLERSRYPIQNSSLAIQETVTAGQLAKGVVHALKTREPKITLGPKTLSQIEGFDMASSLLDQAVSHSRQNSTRLTERSSAARSPSRIAKLAQFPIWVGVCAVVLGAWLLKDD